ncbi:unnamed protein product [Bursaphelenchus okinawaensis]|uniref:MARVEL domain-containing protein n=1 Tax=Bursaphelenchus okinawaensis TaxID=465554 RepID=A0A811LFJ8_9BILA|nr:unnamed protein product [Bursaphelenchus okinawaensis]CAG9122188.1 unnamed protein product [Bursaphelenchus okinawaensis]
MIASSSPPPEENVDLDRSRPGSTKSNTSRPPSRRDSQPSTPPERAPSEKTVELIERRPEASSVQPVTAEGKGDKPKSGNQKATVLPKPSSKVSPLATMQKKLNFIPKNQKGSLNTQFFATVPGVLKIAEVVLGFVAFVLAICADRNSTSSAWTEHITFESTIIAGVFLLGYIVFPHLTIDDEKNNNGLVVMELVFYAVNTVAYFISVWLMVHLSASWRADGRGAAIMGAILNVALTVLFGIETFIKFKTFKGEQVLQKPSDKKHYPANASLSPDPESV